MCRGGGRGRGPSRSPPRDASYRRGGGAARGSWRGGSGRGSYGSYSSRASDSFYPGEERFRMSADRDLPRDYGGLDCRLCYIIFFAAGINILLSIFSVQVYSLIRIAYIANYFLLRHFSPVVLFCFL